MTTIERSTTLFQLPSKVVSLVWMTRANSALQAGSEVFLTFNTFPASEEVSGEALLLWNKSFSMIHRKSRQIVLCLGVPETFEARCDLLTRYRILAFAILLTALPVLPAQTSDWAIVKQLLPDQKIEVKTIDGKSHVGHMRSMTDDMLQLQNGQPIPRSDVQQIRLMSPGHRGRNTIVGAAIGAAAGVGLGTACGKDSFVRRGQCIAVATPVMGGLGAIVGAVLPARGKWHEVYRRKD